MKDKQSPPPNREKTEPMLWKQIQKLIDKPPKLRVIPLQQTKDEKLKAKVLSKILEHEWGTIEARIKSEIYQPMIKCFMYGVHRWRGYGEKNRHICKICGWKTWIGNDPQYTGEIQVYWDKTI